MIGKEEMKKWYEERAFKPEDLPQEYLDGFNTTEILEVAEELAPLALEGTMTLTGCSQDEALAVLFVSAMRMGFYLGKEEASGDTEKKTGIDTN